MTGFQKTQIVFISSIDWEAAWQRHQIFATQFAVSGHEVFFIENSGFRDPGFSDLGRLGRKLSSFRRPAGGTNPIPPGLHLFPPRVLPPTTTIFRKINSRLLVPQLTEELREAGLRPHPFIVCYHPTATTLALIARLAPSLLVYDCASNFRAHPQAPLDFTKQERALLEQSQLVVCDSDYLYEQKQKEHPNVLQIHQGVAETFLLGAPPRGTWDNFIYYGTWGPDLEPAYLAALSQAGFAVTVSGFSKGKAPALPAQIERLPPAPKEDLVTRLEAFECFVLPYRLNPFLMGVVPAKIYECLAMGRPIIASPLPSLAPLKDLIHIAETPEDWVRIARDLNKTETPQLRQARIELARQHTHQREFERLYVACEEAYIKAPPPHRAPKEPWWGGPHVQAFLRGFSWIGLLFGVAKTATLLTQVFAGRMLGPAEYGHANLVFAVSSFLQILPILGFPLALSKFVADEQDDAKRRAIISTASVVFAVWSGLWLCVLAFFHEALAAWLSLPPHLLRYAILFSFCTAFYVVISSPLLGLRRFAERGISEAIYGLSAPIFLWLLLKGARTYEAMVITLCLSLAASAAYSAWCLRGYLKPAFDRTIFSSIFSYALVASLNLLTTACILAPGRLILNHHDSPFAVGVFSAYFTSTAQISLAFLYILTAVLVPVASSAAGQIDAWIKFRRLRTPLLLGAFLFFLCSGGVALSLFGKQYPFDLKLLLLFALGAALILIQGIAAALYSARDFQGLRISVTGSMVAGVTNLGLSLLLIPAWGILGAALAVVGGYTASLSYYASKR